MAKPDPNITRPEKSLVLTDSDMTLTMTYAVFNDILRFVGGLEEAMVSIMTNQEVRDLIVRRMLTDTKKVVKDIDDLVPSEEIELDIFELDELLSWVMEHVTYFFMRTATRIQQSVTRYPEMLDKMKTSSNLSETGLIPSETPTKSVGPTE